MTHILANYTDDRWLEAKTGLADIRSALTGEIVARTGSDGVEFGAVLDHARGVGGPALRALTFQQRAAMLKAIGLAILERKDELYALSAQTGATRHDGWIDIEGGAGTLLALASRGRKELPDDVILIDGDFEPIGRRGTFAGQHVYTSRQGAAVQINAFNFPVWGMLEKMGPALLAGVPVIVKPATATAQLAEAAFRILIEAKILPAGSVQLVVGSLGDLFDHLTGQDVVSFTGSAETAATIAGHPAIAREAVRFIAERDSLNASILGPDAAPGTPEFELFVAEVVREMTIKAGQKCTAIRRAIVPEACIDDVQEALCTALGKVVVGDPAVESVTMGALASAAQKQDVLEKTRQIGEEATLVFGAADSGSLKDGDARGAFVSPLLFRTDAPWASDVVHDVETFGPVATLMPYRDLADAVALANRGKGALVLSCFTNDPAVVRALVSGTGPFHGRMLFVDRESAGESTGHGSPLPMLVHGGPGRAGGGEEMGGLRGVRHYLQRTALQGSPRMLAAVVGSHLPGAPQPTGEVHPFRLRFDALCPGYTHHTGTRTVTLEDIENFAHFTGDTFYAHMDEEAAARSPIFGGRVAHGYLLLSFAAGLFVAPEEGPVLANYGLEGLRFVKPVKPGETIKVALTVKAKTRRSPDMGEVRWGVAITNQDDDLVATYDLLTMNAA